MKTLRAFFHSFLPKRMHNHLVAVLYDGLHLFRTSKRVAKRNQRENLGELTRLLQDRNDRYIENQAALSRLRMGKKKSISYGGCGMIALHNMRISLGEAVSAKDTADLFYEMERMGSAWFGLAGISPIALLRYLKRHGYFHEVLFSKEERRINAFGSMERKCPFATFLVTAYNNKENIMEGLHTVNIAREGSGFVIHNAYRREGTQPRFVRSLTYASLAEAIVHIDTRFESQALMVIGVSGYCRGGMVI